jgi:hypothetical protein
MNTPETAPVQGRLDASDVQRFRREGYLLPPGPILSADKFARLRDTFERLLGAWPSDRRPEDMDVPHFDHPELFHWLFDDDVLDLVTPILGPDVALFSSHFLCKPAGDGRRVPWHQDSFYWRHMMDPVQVVTVWLAIDPSTADNGAMRVIPRTHRDGDAAYEDVDVSINTFPKEIKRELLREDQAVTLALRPNHCSLHDAGLFHGSARNLSTTRRCGYTMRYMSTRTRFNHEAVGAYHQIYLARGRDHAGNLYGDPARAHPELLARRADRVRRGH